MIAAAEALAGGPPLAYDVCVIGSGPAGTSAAVELAGAGLRVAVLEGGPLGSDRRSRDPLRGVVVEGAFHDELHTVRQRRLGGTTASWGGRCAPLDPVDFASRPELDRPGWPFGREALDPYYARAQEYCEAGDYDYQADTAIPAAPPFVLDDRPSLLDDQKLWRWGPPVRFGARYRGFFERGPNVTLLHGAQVVLLHRDPTSGSVEHAVVATAPGRELRVRARTFVLAGGGLEVARLMLASGFGDRSPALGRYYMTHPTVEGGQVRFAAPERAQGGGYLRTHDGAYGRRILAVEEAAQREHALPNAAFGLWYPEPRDPAHGDGMLSSFALVRTLLTRSGLNWKSSGLHRRFGETEQLGRHAANVARQLPTVVRLAGRFSAQRWAARRSIPSFFHIPPGAAVRFRVDLEQLPEGRNRVTLERERDAFGLPRLRVDMRLGAREREGVRRSFALIGEEFGRLGIGSVGTDDLAGPSAEPFGAGPHQMGLTRIAASPRDGVVDPECRVHGAANLFVASSSVFPSGGAIGPTLTIVALAVRIADRVAREARSAPVAAAV